MKPYLSLPAIMWLLIFSQLSLGQSLDSFLKFNNNLLVSAHRGGYYLSYPENSLSLFRYVLAQNPGRPVMFEIDIREDKDGKLWLMHDNTLERTTTGKGLMNKTSSKKIQALKLKDQSSQITKEPVTDFDSLLTIVRENQVYLMLDIKSPSMEKVVNKLKATGLEDKCLILTFTPENTLKAMQLTDKSMVAALVSDEAEWKNLKALENFHKRLVIYVTEKTPADLITQLNSSGFPIMSDPRELWNGHNTVLSADFYQQFIKKLQLNIMVTDFPVEVISYLTDSQQGKSINNDILNLHLKKFRWMESLQLDSLAALLHEDVYYIHSNGWKENKKEVLENLHSDKLRYHKVTVTESDCRVIGDMAIVTGKGIFQVSMEGTLLEIKLYYTEVYTTSENTMRLVSRHACRLP